jgi:hypothetical protein
MNAQTDVENRLIYALVADNAPFTTTLSFAPFQSKRMGKPGGFAR